MVEKNILPKMLLVVSLCLLKISTKVFSFYKGIRYVGRISILKKILSEKAFIKHLQENP